MSIFENKTSVPSIAERERLGKAYIGDLIECLETFDTLASLKNTKDSYENMAFGRIKKEINSLVKVGEKFKVIRWESDKGKIIYALEKKQEGFLNFIPEIFYIDGSQLNNFSLSKEITEK